MARRSLRTKLIAAVIVAALPALALSAWQAVDQQRNADLRKSETVAATAELAAARYRTLIEGSRRLLEAVCAEDGSAGIGGEMVLDVLLGGVHPDRRQRDRERRGLAVEWHLHALRAHRQPEHRRIRREWGCGQRYGAHPEGDDRGSTPPCKDHLPTLRAVPHRLVASGARHILAPAWGGG